MNQAAGDLERRQSPAPTPRRAGSRARASVVSPLIGLIDWLSARYRRPNLHPRRHRVCEPPYRGQAGARLRSPHVPGPSLAGRLRPRARPPAAPPAQPRDEAWDARFRALPSTDSLRSYLRHLSARPHHLGSAVRAGQRPLDARPLRRLGLGRADRHLRCALPHAPRAGSRAGGAAAVPRAAGGAGRSRRPTTAQRAEQLPGYHAYSADGDVTAPLVYVNYGIPADYERLERMGVSVKGAIVIARYGGSWRGIKPKVAAEHGAVGTIIYSDPKDDGYFAGDVYPAGPMRPPGGVQRGSVADMPYHPGDPAHPGRRSHPGRQETGTEGREDDHQDSGPPDLLCRRRSRCSKPWAAGWRRRRGAARCRSRTTWVRGLRAST